jgi:hypothetical protein
MFRAKTVGPGASKTPKLGLCAAHVRTEHVHAVVLCVSAPIQIIRDSKAYARRKLNALRIDSPNRKRWARHGSTRYLYTPDSADRAVRYVISEQGDPIALYVGPIREPE